MKKYIFTLLLIAVCGTASAQDKEIKKSITTFFEGMYSRDTIKIKSVCNAPLLLQSIASKNGKTVLKNESTADFYKSIATIPAEMKIEERLLDYKIQYDGAMAHVWTPYEFYVNGKLSHSGVNSFQLYNDNGIWKITYIIDTRRK